MTQMDDFDRYLDELGPLGPCQLPAGILQRFGRQRRIESCQRVAQALCEHNFAVIAALGRGHVRRDVGAVGDSPAGGLKPGERGLLDDGFGKSRRHRF